MESRKPSPRASTSCWRLWIEEDARLREGEGAGNVCSWGDPSIPALVVVVVLMAVVVVVEVVVVVVATGLWCPRSATPLLRFAVDRTRWRAGLRVLERGVMSNVGLLGR